VAAIALGGCKDSNAPSDPNRIVKVGVSVRYDSAAFRNNREFVLALVPVDGNNRVVLADSLEVTVTMTSTGAPTASVAGKNVVAADPRPLSAAILLDNSTSMGESDPNDLRLAGARLFWQTVLADKPTNSVALLGFSDAPATPGFRRTQLLQTWTSTAALLEQGLANVQLADGSRMYTSAREVSRWIDSTRPSSDRRVLVLFTDGAPLDSGQGALISTATTAGVAISTVGLGAASSESGSANGDAVARLRTIADETNGLYLPADSPDDLGTTFQALATSSVEGVMLVRVRLTDAPAPGTQLVGRVRVANKAGGADAEWTVSIK
jgi:hypothetical protein